MVEKCRSMQRALRTALIPAAFALLAAYGNDAADACVPSSMLKTHPSAVVRATKASAWALLEYRERGEVSHRTFCRLVESTRRENTEKRDGLEPHMREVLEQMGIACK